MKADDFLQYIETFGGFAKSDVRALAIKERCLRARHEEVLGATGVRSLTTSHNEVTLGVGIGAALIQNVVANAVRGAESAALDDVDGWIGTEDRGAVVVLVAGQCDEVVHRARHSLCIECHDNRAL